MLTPRVTYIDQLNLILTNRCNLGCITCSYPKQKANRYLRRETILRILPSLKEYGLQRVYISGGEPTMHPEFDQILNDLSKADLDLTLITNGTFLEQHIDAIRDRLNRCIISLDGHTAELYESIRRGRVFEQLIKLPALLRNKSPVTHVTTCLVVQRRNFRHLASFLEFAIKLGVDSISFLAPDLSGFTNPSERGGAFGHWTAFPDEKVNDIALTLDEIAEMRQTVIPAVRAVLDKYPGYESYSISLLPTFASYFEAFRLGIPRIECRRCALPFHEIVLDERENLRFCFFTPDTWSVNEVIDPVNHEGIVRARKDYLESDERLSKHCNMCLQAKRVEN